MLQVIGVEQKIEDTKLAKDICEVGELVKDIQRQLNKYNKIDEIDFMFVTLAFEKTKKDLIKVNTLLNVNTLLKLNMVGETRNGQIN